MTGRSAKLVSVFIAVMTLDIASGAPREQRPDTSDVYNFTVWLDDRPIGHHKVNVSRQENRKTVHTQAHFDVRMLFVPVYTYEHETHEQWVDNCLVDIRSVTDDNGDNYFVSSMLRESRLSLETRDGVTSLDGCVRTFAYWDNRLLQSERLLNTQTGEYMPVEVTDMGDGMLDTGNGQIDARHFRLVTDKMVIDLWYTSDMQWLALESVTDSGAVLRYLPANLSTYSAEADS